MADLKTPRDVLVVDDEKSICEILRQHLDDMGIFRNIVFARNGIEASAKLRLQKFSVIILDIGMEKKTGLQIVQEFTKSDLNRVEDILIVSGQLDRIKMEVLVKHGVRNFLTKPFDGEAFKAKVVKILESH